MLTVTGTFQFLSVIPGFFFVLFSKEVEEGRVDKEESNTIDFLFFKTNDIYMCVYVCVCMCSVYYFVMIPIIFFPPKFAVIFSPEGAFWLL